MSDAEGKPVSKREASPDDAADGDSKKRKVAHQSKATIADSDAEEGGGASGNEQPVEVLKNADGDPYIEMSKVRRLTVREFKGATLIDIREYYEDKKTGKSLPGKKGISLSVDQWKLLKEAMPTIDEMIEGKSGKAKR